MREPLGVADAEDLDAAAEAAAWGIFFNQGEICNAASRLLVEASIKDEFVKRVIAKSAQYAPGDPLDPASAAGAIVSDACDITVPFGVAKQSGFGRDRSLHAMEKYTELKGISITYRP